MKCYECGGKYKQQTDSKYRVDDEFIGTFYVKNVEFVKCDHCGDVLLPPETLLKIEEVETRVLNERLQAMPISAFLSSAETAEMLGITRQALHKHRRISRGFVYQTSFGGKKVYLKKSVERFRDHNDGRFKLFNEKEIESGHRPFRSSEDVSQIKRKQLDEFQIISAAQKIPKSSPAMTRSTKSKITSDCFPTSDFYTSKNTEYTPYIQESEQSYPLKIS